MILLNANYTLRYLMQDNETMFATATETILNKTCFVPNEVLAEVVYVLSGVYKVPKDAIANTLTSFVMLNNISLSNEKK